MNTRRWAVIVSYEEGDDVWSYLDSRRDALKKARARATDCFDDPSEQWSGRATRVAVVSNGDHKILTIEAWNRTDDGWINADAEQGIAQLAALVGAFNLAWIAWAREEQARGHMNSIALNERTETP